MATNEKRESFGAALHEAAQSFEPPLTEQLHGDAVSYGRRIKRRRAAGAGAAGVVVLAVAGALTVTLTGSGSGAGDPAVIMSSGPVNAKYMSAAFTSVLPSTAKLTSAVTGTGYTSQTGGGWYAGVYATVLVSGKQYVLTLSIMDSVTETQACGTPSPGSFLFCDAVVLRGGPFDAGTTLSGRTTYSWVPVDYRSDSIVVTVGPDSMVTHPTSSPFTMKQIEQFVTADVWTEVFKDLPAMAN